MPNAEFVSDPDMDFTIELDVDGTIASIIAEIFNFAGDFAKKYILPVMKDKIHELLAMVLEEIPTKVEIGDYWLDLTLAAPIQLKNKFLQVNSYALLFSKEYPETQNKTRYVYPISLQSQIINSNYLYQNILLIQLRILI